jgi:RNA polymerase sigma factor (sigma-70 family)
MLSSDELRRKLNSVIPHPVRPSKTLEIVELARNPSVSASQLGKAIASEEALAQRVLSIVNSPYYGFTRRITSIDFAVAAIGFEALRDIVIGTAQMKTVDKQIEHYFHLPENERNSSEVCDNITPMDASVDDIDIEDVRRRLSTLIEQMPECERLVVTLYYYEGMTFAEIAQVLRLSSPRVESIHAAVIQRVARMPSVMEHSDRSHQI